MSEPHIVKNSDLAIASLEQRVAQIERKLDQLLLGAAGEKSVERPEETNDGVEEGEQASRVVLNHMSTALLSDEQVRLNRVLSRRYRI